MTKHKNWIVKSIGESVYTVSIPKKIQKKDYKSEGKYPIVDQGKQRICGYSNEKECLVKDIPLVIFGDHTKEIKYVDFNFLVGADGTKLLKSKILTTEFLFQLLIYYKNSLPDLGYSRYFTELKNIDIKIPPLPEQQKIAEVLATWDKAIQYTDAIIKNLIARNKTLANTLISFKDSSNQKKIKEVVNRIRNSFTPNKEELYVQIGIRSHAKGLFYKEPVTGQELGNKSVFWIEPNCFIVNIVFAWEQAVAKTTDKEVGYIASHRFPMYSPKENLLDLDYLLFLFKTPKGKDLLEFASPGGAGRNKTLGQSNFLDLNIPVPSIEKQRYITEILNTADQEVKKYQEKLDTLKLQKKGLMQQLLTGKVRTA